MTNNLSPQRENNYDILRIICAAMVIMLHVSAGYLGFAANGSGVPEQSVGLLMTSVYRALTVFAVPCFIMLSGAFILDDERNADYRYFYSKTLLKIGIPTIVFSLLYVLYKIPLCFTGVETGSVALVGLLEDVVTGAPMYHMWYLFMLIGVYLLAPIVIRFKNSISEKAFSRVAVFFFVWATISMCTSSVKLNWDVGRSFEYLGYFMVGYCIRKSAQQRVATRGGKSRAASQLRLPCCLSF